MKAALAHANTTIIGLAKFVVGLALIYTKFKSGESFSAADVTIVTLAFAGGASSVASADASKVSPP